MIKMKKRNFITLIAVVIIASMLLTAGGAFLYVRVINKSVMVKTDTYETLVSFAEKYNKLYQIQNSIDKNFLWDYDENKMLRDVYKAMVNSLDDKYSSYLTKNEMEDWTNYLSGSFSGIGVSFSQDKDGNYYIVRIIENSPAESAGLKAGDRITKLNGRTYTDFEKMAMDMRGEAGTTVKITYIRDGNTKTVNLTRAMVTDKSVFSTVLDDNIGYIAIVSFEDKTAEEFKTELKSMEMKEVDGLVIDIRGNGGGYAEQGIDIADMLLPECTVTYMQDKNGEKTYYNSDESCTALKYAVLVNGNTASTSEILVSAIQDNKGGPIVGTDTFGKGIVQGTYSFRDGSAVKLTIMQYFSPDGKVIHGKGIKPDYVVEMQKTDKTDKQLKKAISLLKD